jgi:hypothetical protein
MPTADDDDDVSDVRVFAADRCDTQLGELVVEESAEQDKCFD